MSYIKIYLHFVFSTKNRFPYFESDEIRNKIWKHIMENARKKKIYIDFINGHSDHCHCIISLKYDQSVQYIMQMIKGESAHWINKNKLTQDKFEWQDEYYVRSVSVSELKSLRTYLIDQKIHHCDIQLSQNYTQCPDFNRE